MPKGKKNATASAKDDGSDAQGDPLKALPVLSEEDLKDFYVGPASVPIKKIQPASGNYRARRINPKHVRTLLENLKSKDPSTEDICLTVMVTEEDFARCENLDSAEIIRLAEIGEITVVVIDGNHRLSVLSQLATDLVGKWTPDTKIRVVLYIGMRSGMALSLARRKNAEAAECRKETVWDWLRMFRRIKYVTQESTSPTDEVKTSTTDVKKSIKEIKKIMGIDSMTKYKCMYQVAQKSLAVWRVVDDFATACENGELENVPDARHGDLSRGAASESRHAIIIFKHIMLACKDDRTTVQILQRCIAEKSYDPLAIQFVETLKANAAGKKKLVAQPAAQSKKRSRSPSQSESGSTGDSGETGGQLPAEPLKASAVLLEDPRSQKIIQDLQNEVAYLEEQLEILRSEDDIMEYAGSQEEVDTLKEVIRKQALQLALHKMHKETAATKVPGPYNRVYVDGLLKIYRGGKLDGDNIVNSTCFGTLQQDVTRYESTEANCTVPKNSVFYVAHELVTGFDASKPKSQEVAFVELASGVVKDILSASAV